MNNLRIRRMSLYPEKMNTQRVQTIDYKIRIKKGLQSSPFLGFKI